MTGFDSKRQMAQAKVRDEMQAFIAKQRQTERERLNDDDDTQVYADTLLIVYQRGFADGKKAANAMHDLARLGQEIEQEPETRTKWNKGIRDSVDALLAQAGYQPDSSARHQLAMMNFDTSLAAQPEQEPCVGKDPRCPCQDGDACHYKDCVGTKARPAAQPEQEPVAYTTMPEAADWDFVSGSKDPTGKLEGKWFPLYTTPPAAQRPWVGLTNKEIAEILCDDRWQMRPELMLLACQAKLKERNT